MRVCVFNMNLLLARFSNFNVLRIQPHQEVPLKRSWYVLQPHELDLVLAGKDPQQLDVE